MVEASWQALVDSIEFKLHKDNRARPHVDRLAKTQRHRGRDAEQIPDAPAGDGAAALNVSQSGDLKRTSAP